MKTTTNLLLAGIIAACGGSIGNAQLIYSNAFNGGAVSLFQTAPIVANSYAGGTNTALWNFTASIYATDTNILLANGTIDGNANSATLPFTPQDGYLYLLTASITLPANMNGQWIAIGYPEYSPVTNQDGSHCRFADAAVNPYNWMLARTGSGSAEQYFPRRGAAAVFSSDIVSNAGTYQLQIALNTQNPTNWTGFATANGVSMGTVSVPTNVIAFVGIGNSGLGAYAAGIQWNWLTLETSLLPLITQEPVPGVTVADTAFTNTVLATAATNGGALFYQWFTNGVPIAGATNAALILDPVAISDAGTNYYVVVTNNYGAVTSAVVSLTVNAASVSTPVLSRVGAADVFSVTALGPSLAYQWYFNTVSNDSGATGLTDGGGVSGSTTADLTFVNLTNYYFVVVTNLYGGVTSSIVQVPQLLTAVSAGKPVWNPASQTNLVVIFSDMVDPLTAAAAGNYTLDNGASVNSGVLAASNEVVLTTSALTPGTNYTLTVQNVENYFGVTLSPSPTNLVVGLYPANLALWVRADTGVTTNADGTVAQWNDLSGNGNTLYGGVPPTFAINSVGDPVIRFGTNDTATNYVYAVPAPTLSLTGDMSVVAVVNLRTVAGGRNGEIVAKTGSGVNANKPAPFDYNVNGGVAGALLRGNAVSFGGYAGTVAGYIGQPVVIAVSETGNRVSHWWNGTATGTGLLSNSFQETNSGDAGNPVYVGARGDFVNRLAGDLSELIVAGSPISSYDVGALDNYLAAQHHLVLFNTSPTKMALALTNSQMTLSWPADHTGWQLQSNSVGLLATNAWFPVGGSTLTNRVTVTPSADQTNVFYRMFFQQP